MSKYYLDKFFTKEEVVEKILQEIDITKYKTIIEPSAGSGAFSKKIPCIAYDIDPEAEGIIKHDFLTVEINEEKPILVIGNPPFGRNNNMALAFINHAAKFADTIAFILPKSFKKDSLYYKIPLNFWRVKQIDLDDNSFTLNGKEFNVPCVFQIYEKKEIEREKPIKIKPRFFDFVSKEDANVSIRRVGVYAGKAFLNTDKSEQSHYFIKAEEPEKIIKIINSIKWKYNNTVGPRSISKPELIFAIEREIEKHD